MEKSKFKRLGCVGTANGPTQCHSAARGSTYRGVPPVSGSLNAKRYRATWCVGSSSNPTALVHRPRRAAPARQNPNAAGGGRRGLTGAQARVGNAGERRSRRRRTSWYWQLLLGRLQSLAPFFSSSGGLQPNSGNALLALLQERGGTISEERGVRWCEEFERERPLFIVSTTRPNGMGR